MQSNFCLYIASFFVFFEGGCSTISCRINASSATMWHVFVLPRLASLQVQGHFARGLQCFLRGNGALPQEVCNQWRPTASDFFSRIPCLLVGSSYILVSISMFSMAGAPLSGGAHNDAKTISFLEGNNVFAPASGVYCRALLVCT